MSLEPRREDVEQKVGRNVILFQQMEASLKTLLAISNVSGFSRNIKETHHKRVKSKDKRTMGQLAEQFRPKVLFHAEEPDPGPKE